MELLLPISEEAGSARVSGDRLELLHTLINGPRFDAIYRPDVINIPATHPVFHWRCRIIACERTRHSSKDFCERHIQQWRKVHKTTTRGEFIRTAEAFDDGPLAELAPCRVCPDRPSRSITLRLCNRHRNRWDDQLRRQPEADFADWLTKQLPYQGYGICRVRPCSSLAQSPLGLCSGHEWRYKHEGHPGQARLPRGWFNSYEHHGRPVPVAYDDEAEFQTWCHNADPLFRSGRLTLLGLRPLVAAEIKWGLFSHAQQRHHSNWPLQWIQHLIDLCRARDLRSLTELDLDGCHHIVRMIAVETLTHLRLVYFSPADTKDAGYIDTDHFGVRLTGRLSYFDLSAVTQRWLRDLLWEYVAERLRDPNGPRSGSPYDTVRRGCVELSVFLQADAPGGGHDPTVLNAEHLHRFVADQRHRERNGLPSLGVHRSDGKPSQVTDVTRRIVAVYVRKLLRWARDTEHAARIGLSAEFITAAPTGGPAEHRSRRPFPDEVAQALADDANLQELARAYDPNGRGLRDIWETLVLTGRRAREVINLRLDCLGRYNDLPLLWHDQTKVDNYDEAIRIPDRLYELLQQRQRSTLERFEYQHGRPPSAAERSEMALFPSNIRNPDGARSMSYHWFLTSFRQWLADLDIGAWVPHQARHTLATKLLAHGAGLHHIKRYLGQVSSRMAEHYAKVALSEIEDVLQHVWVAGPGAANPGELVAAPTSEMDRRQAEALAIDLTRRSTPTEGGLCTFQPVVNGSACPWKLNCEGCDKFVLSGADLLYWRRKREQWSSIAERAPDDTTADYLHQVFEPTGRAIDGLEKALAGLGLLDEALALDLRRPQDYFHRMWNLSFRATDLANAPTEGEPR